MAKTEKGHVYLQVAQGKKSCRTNKATCYSIHVLTSFLKLIETKAGHKISIPLRLN